jgi:peptidoglycan/xylan/chitin deacetylase (PgdA/CDA1 family)
MNGDGMSEQNLRENPGGPPRINERNYNTESEYEYGSRAGFWRMFRLFNKYKMKFTLYAVAQAVEQQPEVAKRCVEEGHDVASQYVVVVVSFFFFFLILNIAYRYIFS